MVVLENLLLMEHLSPHHCLRQLCVFAICPRNLTGLGPTPCRFLAGRILLPLTRPSPWPRSVVMAMVLDVKALELSLLRCGNSC